MSRKRYTPEQIIGMLRKVEMRLSQGQTVGRPSPKIPLTVPASRNVAATAISVIESSVARY